MAPTFHEVVAAAMAVALVRLTRSSSSTRVSVLTHVNVKEGLIIRLALPVVSFSGRACGAVACGAEVAVNVPIGRPARIPPAQQPANGNPS